VTNPLKSRKAFSDCSTSRCPQLQAASELLVTGSVDISRTGTDTSGFSGNQMVLSFSYWIYDMNFLYSFIKLFILLKHENIERCHKDNEIMHDDMKIISGEMSRK